MPATASDADDAQLDRSLLALAAAAFGVTGIVLIGLAADVSFLVRYKLTLQPIALACVGSSSLVAALAFASCGLFAWLRRRPDPGSRGGPPGAWLRRLTSLQDVGPETTETSAVDLRWLATWPQQLAAIAICVLAVAGIVAGWRNGDGETPSPSADLATAIGCLVGAFSVLVLERHLASLPASDTADAPRLQRIVRVPLASLLVIATASALRCAGYQWPLRIEQANAMLVALVASEVILRCSIRLFLPFPPFEQARSLIDSAIARAIRPAPQALASISDAVRKEFGLDLSRSWAFGFVRRAALPVAAGLGFLAWLCTGITALPLDTRAIYERLGAPVATLGPGLHLHLPWPLGIVRRVELGVIHDIPIVFAANGSTPAGAARDVVARPRLARTGAEDPPPAPADRLWDQPHASEATFLVASESRGQQGFQVVDIDLRLVYRVGLSDAAALAAAFRVADPQRLVQAAAGRLLARYFASHTLASVLVADRETFTAEFRAALQAEMDRLATGLDAVAVIVEAVHPPQGAANAYHSVQAAEIEAKIAIATERGAAAQTESVAAQDAARIGDKALTEAATVVSQAQAEQTLFEGDRAAYRHGRPSFVLERWFARLKAALGRLPLVIVDHRISATDLPALDLRGSPAAPLPPQ